MENVVVMDSVLAIRAGPRLPMGQHVLSVHQASFWTPLVTVKVRFSMFPFVPSKRSSQYVHLDALSAPMARQIAFLASRASPRAELTKQRALHYQL